MLNKYILSLSFAEAWCTDIKCECLCIAFWVATYGSTMIIIFVSKLKSIALDLPQKHQLLIRACK